MATKVRDIVRELEAAGWVKVDQRGDHRYFEHPARPGKVTVAGGWNVGRHSATGRAPMRRFAVETLDVVVRPKVHVILEGDAKSWSAYVPSIPGCIAAAKTRDELERLIEEAIAFHLEHLHEDALREEEDAVRG